MQELPQDDLQGSQHLKTVLRAGFCGLRLQSSPSLDLARSFLSFNATTGRFSGDTEPSGGLPRTAAAPVAAFGGAGGGGEITTTGTSGVHREGGGEGHCFSDTAFISDSELRSRRSSSSACRR
jgi:hypothetical protein